MLSLLRLCLNGCADFAARPTRCLQNLFLSKIYRRVRIFCFRCARCAGGHTSCVQNSFLGKTHPRGGEPRKPNIAAADDSVTPSTAKSSKNFVAMPFCNPLKRKQLVISANLGKTTPCPWPPSDQRLGYSLQNIMRIPQSATRQLNA